LLEKFEGRGFTVLAVNYAPAERYAVAPLMQANRYTFTVLQAPEGWTSTMRLPENSLVDQLGRVVFLPDFTDAEGMRVAEREVEWLLTGNVRP